MRDRDRYFGKLLAYLLRHAPESYGVTLDRRGWASVEELVEQLRRRDHEVDPQAIHSAIAADPKGRYELSDDGRRVRALYGHSVDVDPQHPPVIPPEVLYHGTQQRWMTTIRREGLRPMRRGLVHLSGDRATARQVGGRRPGALVVLEVRTSLLLERGQEFFHPSPTVWLTDSVSPDAVVFP